MLRRRPVALLLLSAVLVAAYLIGLRVAILETPTGSAVRTILYDGGAIENIWTDLSQVFTSHLGKVLAFALLGAIAVFLSYLIGCFAVWLTGKLAKKAKDQVLAPFRPIFRSLQQARVNGGEKLQSAKQTAHEKLDAAAGVFGAGANVVTGVASAGRHVAVGAIGSFTAKAGNAKDIARKLQWRRLRSFSGKGHHLPDANSG